MALGICDFRIFEFGNLNDHNILWSGGLKEVQEDATGVVFGNR